MADTPAEFLSRIKPWIVAAARRSGVPASVLAAQAGLESGWGTSRLATANNLFGQKVIGSDPYANGQGDYPTQEWDAKLGQMVDVTASFYHYPSIEASVEAHADYITGRIGTPWVRQIYGGQHPVEAHEFAVWLVTPPRGYATDPQYPAKLESIIDRYGLRAWDQEEEPVGNIRDTLCNIADKAAAANIGYDQSQRRSWYNDSTGKITEGPSECDCSALTFGIWRLAGVPINGDTYTARMEQDIRAAGGTIIDVRGWSLDRIKATMKPGDAVGGPGHVVFVMRNGKVLSAEGDERGQSSGGQAGDQTGREVVIKDLYNRSKGWTIIGQPPGADLGVSSPVANQTWTHKVAGCKSLNVRKTPPTPAGLGEYFTTVSEGAKLNLVDPQGGVRAKGGAWWHEVVFEGGSRGWVNVNYITKI